MLSLAPLVLCCGGVPPLPPWGGRLRPRGAPVGCTTPPAGPLARAPCARWPTSRPSPVVDARYRLVLYSPGRAVPNVSCGRLFSGCALGLGLAPVTSLLPGWALRPGPIGPGALRGRCPLRPCFVWCGMVLRSKVLPVERLLKKKLLPQPMLYIIVVSL